MKEALPSLIQSEQKNILNDRNIEENIHAIMDSFHNIRQNN